MSRMFSLFSKRLFAAGTLAALLGACWPSGMLADGPADNIPAKVRRIPKLGIELTPDQQGGLLAELTELGKKIESLRGLKDAKLRSLIPDVEIFHKAVSDAVNYQEIFDAKEVGGAYDLLKIGRQRADELAAGKSPWTTATGPVVRGYVSKIDGSVQPYSLVVPASYSPTSPTPYRLDVWLHGRGETLSELNYIRQGLNQKGPIAPPNAFVLHSYGRYCNAFKFAGEIDILEGLAAVQAGYPIDEDRLVMRGFSMGGAGCWQMAVHYADKWVAAAPGAGFSETADFLRVFQKESIAPTWFEQKLWQWYDCTDWAANLYNCPTVAYSGEIDTQKQAADIMQKALYREGIDLVHIIGPKTGHAYHPQSQAEINRRIDSIARQGRNRMPMEVRFVTYTLRYNKMHWVTVEGLNSHWEKARVDAKVTGPGELSITTMNVTDLSLDMPAGLAPFAIDDWVKVTINGQKLDGPRPGSDRSWRMSLNRQGEKWAAGTGQGPKLAKRPGLQGPIDDAFMDSFIFVKPTGKALNTEVDKWSQSEMTRAIEHWRRHFRGQARVMEDGLITEKEIAASNLVLWGDPGSNAVLKKIIDQLPIHWDADNVLMGGRKFSAADHAVAMIYPNPLNPSKYIVINSSFTFREYAYLNNARQVPMLPDWAVVDIRTPAGAVWPGKIVAADFFDERWDFKTIKP